MKIPHFFLFMVISFTSAACGSEVPAGPILLNELEEMYKNKLAHLREETEKNIAGWPADGVVSFTSG